MLLEDDEDFITGGIGTDRNAARPRTSREEIKSMMLLDVDLSPHNSHGLLGRNPRLPHINVVSHSPPSSSVPRLYSPPPFEKRKREGR